MSGNKGKSRNKRKLNPEGRTDREEARRARVHSPDDQQVTDGDKDGTSSGGSGRTKPVDRKPVDDYLAEIKFDERKYNKERSHLLMLLPEDVWDLVFEKLDDCPEVLENLSNASLVLRNLLLPKQITFLFPKVAGIIVQLYEEKSPYRAYSKKQKCTSCSKNRYTMWYSDIFTLRLVCRKWSTSIDNICQNSSHHFEIGRDPRRLSDFMNMFRVAFFADVRQFLQHFDQTHGTQVDRNPFVGSEVWIREIRRNNRKWRQLLDLFTKYGHHIWYFKFDNCDTDIVLESHFYLRLRELLAFMPNLKVLRVFVSSGVNRLDEVHPSKSRRLTFESPLPTLPNLQMLETNNLPTVTFRELLRSNGHLSKLQIREKNITDLDLAFRSETLLNLEQVALSYELTEENWTILKKDHRFPLQKLNLYIEKGNWKIQQIFKLLSSKWSETLTHLILSFPIPKHGNRNNMQSRFSTAKLNLAHISNLELRMHAYHNLDFLMPMKNTLEFLDIDVRTYDNWTTSEIDKWKLLAGEAEAQQDIKFWSCSPPTLETNLWSLFPQLKRVKCHEIPNAYNHVNTLKWSHTRTEWVTHMKMKSLKIDVQ